MIIVVDTSKLPCEHPCPGASLAMCEIDPTKEIPIPASEGTVVIEPTTINSLISDHRTLTSTVESVAVHNLFKGLTFRLPIICTLPERLGYYSCRVLADGEHDSYQPNKMALPYLRADWLEFRNLDLAIGFDYRPKIYRILPETDHIYQWIHEHHDPDVFLSINFVCTSTKFLKQLMAVPYNGNSTWNVFAIRVGRTIYLTSKDPNGFIRRGGSYADYQVENSYIEHKFVEALVYQPTGCKLRTFPSGNRDSFYIVNKLEIGHHKILYPHRVDCAIDEEQYMKPINQMKFAQFRTRPIETDPQKKAVNDVRRAITWWITSFLGGADTVIVGEKSSKFMIESVKSMKAEELMNSQIPNTVKWTPKKCIDYLKRVLSFIEDETVQEKVIYRFRWNSHRERVDTRLIKESYLHYVPRWYVESRNRVTTRPIIHIQPSPYADRHVHTIF